MNFLTHLLLLLGTSGVTAAVLVRWPRATYAALFAFCLFWSGVNAAIGWRGWAAWFGFLALAALVLMAVEAATRGRGAHRATPTPARPMRRMP